MAGQPLSLNSYLGTCRILLKDFGQWAESVTAKVRSVCSAQADELGIATVYLRSASIDKEAYARPIMKERGISTGDI